MIYGMYMYFWKPRDSFGHVRVRCFVLLKIKYFHFYTSRLNKNKNQSQGPGSYDAQNEAMLESICTRAW